MKPVVIGLLFGAVFGFVAACFFLYSLWLPITAICILISGFVGRSHFQTRFLPSGLASLAAMALYFGIFWAPSEVAAATAESPTEHARAASLLATRGGHIFGADERAFQHYLLAAEGGHGKSLMVVAEAYLYGHYGLPRDPEKARPWLERAQDLGIEAASKSLLDPYHFPENRSEQAEADKASPVCS
jgi:TPR repeat protein